MSHEAQQQELPPESRQHIDAARDAFRAWTGSRDEARFQGSYLGHYPNREAFGRELLAGLGVDRPLSRLPGWLQGYVRLDGEAAVRDFEAAGHFYVVETPEDGGTDVFDAYGQTTDHP